MQECADQAPGDRRVSQKKSMNLAHESYAGILRKHLADALIKSTSIRASSERNEKSQRDKSLARMHCA